VSLDVIVALYARNAKLKAVDGEKWKKKV